MADENSEKIWIIPSKSDEFIHGIGKHKGFKIFPDKLANCLLISTEVKELYNVLKSFCFSGKSTCHPSRELLCDILGIEENALGERLSRLEESGLVTVVKHFQKNSSYQFHEFHEVPILYHSEVIYTEVHPHLSGKDFRVKIKEYKKSELFKSIKTCEDVVSRTSEIRDWFFGAIESKKEETTSKRTPKIAPKPTGVESGETNKKPVNRVKAADYKQKTVDTWNLQNFKDYFRELYEETFKLPLPPIGEKTVNSLTNIIRINKDNALVKEYMDIFIDNSTKFQDASLAVFCWNSSQASLAHYKRTGDFLAMQNYNKAGTKKEELPEDDDYALMLKALRDGGKDSG